MAGSRRRQDAILADQQLLHAVGRPNLGDQLDDFRVPEAAITADDEGSTCAQQAASIFLYAPVVMVVMCGGGGGGGGGGGRDCTFGALRDGKQDARYKGLAVVRLLENGDLLPKTGAAWESNVSIELKLKYTWRGRGSSDTYVPGFWSGKGLNSTVLTLMLAVSVRYFC